MLQNEFDCFDVLQSEDVLSRANTEEEVSSDTANEVQDLAQLIRQQSEAITG
jgi:hypothetical protein